ncbi:MAG: glycosyltransferase [Deltaproteobacteria bacterium]|nr:glycosyltransferase [Deltaproteobacteria bacterium]
MERQRIQALKFFYRPLISVIMPVYNPDLAVLKAAVESVLDQTYNHWELCVADGSDLVSGTEIKELLRKYAQRDKRIRVNYLEKNKGISGNSNEALKMAEGAFVAFLDHDDTIAPFALFRMVERLNQNPDLDLLYSDRDLLSWDGQKRFRPFFKPDWSPETLVSVNYLVHLIVIRKSLVERAGGFRAEMDGAQDWDLFFRITEMTSLIVHIPEILYHWRVGPHSAAWSLMAKPYVVQAQFQAVKRHFERAGIDVKVTLGRRGFIKIKWNNLNPLKVSIVMVVKSSKKILEKSLKIILAKTKFSDYEILLVGSPMEQPAVQHIPSGGLIRKINPPVGLNLPELRNLGAEKAAGRVLVFMEDDLEVVDPDWLDDLSGWVGQEEIGAVGGKILNADRTIQSAGLILTEGERVVSPFAGLREYYGKFGSSEWYRNYPVVSSSCLTVRKEVFEEVRQFDTQVTDENDILGFCFRLQRYGYRIVFSPYTRLRNFG